MASLTLSLSGNASVLESQFFPPIELDSNYEYVCGLVDFQTYNSIPNIDSTNNKFYYYPRDVSVEKLETIALKNRDSDNKRKRKREKPQEEEPTILPHRVPFYHSTYDEELRQKQEQRGHYFPKRQVVEIPIGEYGIESLLEELHIHIADKGVQNEITLDPKTSKVKIRCDKYIDFIEDENSIASLLGFTEKQILSPKITHTAQESVDRKYRFPVLLTNNRLYLHDATDSPIAAKVKLGENYETKRNEKDAWQQQEKNTEDDANGNDIVKEIDIDDDIPAIINVMPKIITIPEGTYELFEIITFLTNELSRDGVKFYMTVNRNTLKGEIYCNAHIDFTASNTLKSIFGFESRILRADEKHISDNTLNIFKVNTIHVECNLVSGAFMNGKPCHTIHEFFPAVASGYKIIEVPQNVIYLPVVTRSIPSITIRFLDQNGNLVDFRKETITCRIHIKRLHRFDRK